MSPCASPPGTSIRSSSGIENLAPGCASAQPDVVCLQEIKCVDEAFPREPFEALGYNVAVHGQKTFNGVAILSKLPFDEVTPRPAGRRRRRAGALHRGAGLDRRGVVRVASHLSAQRQSAGHRQISLQARWMERLVRHARERLALEEPLVLAGDYNVIPTARRRAQSRRPGSNDALFLPQTRASIPRAASISA